MKEKLRRIQSIRKERFSMLSKSYTEIKEAIFLSLDQISFLQRNKRSLLCFQPFPKVTILRGPLRGKSLLTVPTITFQYLSLGNVSENSSMNGKAGQ